MSIRKYSTDNSSDNDSDTGLNRAVLMSESRNSLTEKSLATEQNFRSSYGFDRYSEQRSLGSSNSSEVIFSSQNKNQTMIPDKENQGDSSRAQNTETSLPVGNEFEVKAPVNLSRNHKITSQDQPQNLLPESRKIEVEVSKPTIISDEILRDPKKDLNDNLTTHDNVHEETPLMKRRRILLEKFDFYLKGTKEKNKSELLSRGSEASSNASEVVEKFTAANLEKSNIWPALNALDTTFTKADGNTSTDHADITENLSKQFSYSPRSFTETLLTIIEESFVESEEVPDGFLQFLKRPDGAEFSEKISSPKLVYYQTSGEVTDAVTKCNSDESSFDSTQYKSLKKIGLDVQAKSYRKSPKLSIASKTPNKIQLFNEISPINSVADEKNYPKTPQLIKGPRKNDSVHRLEAESRSSIRKSSRKLKNFVKLPQIVLYPGTPQSQKKSRRFSTQSWDDDEYLTAESESEELENNIGSKDSVTIQSVKPTKIESEESVASNRNKLNMSSIVYHHQQWVQAYEEVSKNKSVIYRSTAAITKTKEICTNQLKTDELKKLRQKRQQCLDLVDQLIKNEANVDASVQEQISSISNSRKLTIEFINVLRACSEYFTCGMNARNALKSIAKSSRYASGLSININQNEDLSPHLSVCHGRKSPRRSMGKKSVRVKSPGAKSLKLYPRSSSKRRSLKGSKSPVVDTTSLRPVSQLRRLFSPGQRAAGCSKSNLNPMGTIQRTTAGFGLQERNKMQRKFKHVVSPVGQYIRGTKLT